MITLDVIDGSIAVLFDFDPGIIEIIKKFPVRKYNPIAKRWLIPRSTHYIQRFAEHLKKNNIQFTITQNITDFIIKENNTKKELIQAKEIIPNTIPDINATLRDYQKKAYGYGSLIKKFILGDDMGLGKTITSLAITKHLKRILIVCPATLKWNWEEEILKFTNSSYCFIHSPKDKIDPQIQYIIISYEMLRARKEYLSKIHFDAIIADESHFIKTRTSQRYKAVRDVAKDNQYILLVTGTPMLNRPVELFTQLNLIAPNEFPNYWDFCLHYCDAHVTRWGWDVTGTQNIEELRNRISPFIIRRSKSEVLTELPPKTIENVYIELSSPIMQEYIEAEQEFASWMYQNPEEIFVQSPVALARAHKLKQIANKEKKNRLQEMIDELTANKEKVVIFSQYKTFIEDFTKDKPTISVITGDVKESDRLFIIHRFASPDNANVLIGTTQCMGYGLNLQCASYCIFVDLLWTPLQHRQAEDRLHRMGQQNCVTVYRLIAKNTIDEEIAKKLAYKEMIINQIMEKDGLTSEQKLLQSVEATSGNLFPEVMEAIKSKWKGKT